MPVRDLAHADAHLYLWTTNAKVEAAYIVARAWGFHPSTLLVWAKNPMGGGLGGAFGISTEFVLFARRGKLKAQARIGRTWFNWKRPYNENGKPKHSSKPPELQAMVEVVSPGPHLEVFARCPRAGWSVWGNEATWFVDAPYVGAAGRHYRRGIPLNYPVLGQWCRSRSGQVIVCEALGADWLPFEHIASTTTMNNRGARRGRRTTAQESVWCNIPADAGQMSFLERAV